MLDPSGMRIYLLKWALYKVDHTTFVVDKHCPGRGSSLVKSNNEFIALFNCCHGVLLATSKCRNIPKNDCPRNEFHGACADIKRW